MWGVASFNDGGKLTNYGLTVFRLSKHRGELTNQGLMVQGFAPFNHGGELTNHGLMDFRLSKHRGEPTNHGIRVGGLAPFNYGGELDYPNTMVSQPIMD